MSKIKSKDFGGREQGARLFDVPLPSALCDRLRAQIGDGRLDEVMLDGRYLDVTAQVLQKYGGLWFTDESFIVTRVAGVGR